MIAEEKLSQLRFQCTGCGSCCKGESGYVLLTQADFWNIFGVISGSDAWQNYLQWVSLQGDDFLSLKEKQNFDCVFLQDDKCSVYSKRPMQCRIYPFWDSVLKSEYSWKKESRFCPGMNSGKITGLDEIGQKVIEQRSNPYLNKKEIPEKIMKILKRKNLLPEI